MERLGMALTRFFMVCEWNCRGTARRIGRAAGGAARRAWDSLRGGKAAARGGRTVGLVDSPHDLVYLHRVNLEQGWEKFP
jgi:hypothetical protein